MKFVCKEDNELIDCYRQCCTQAEKFLVVLNPCADFFEHIAPERISAKKIFFFFRGGKDNKPLVPNMNEFEMRFAEYKEQGLFVRQRIRQHLDVQGIISEKCAIFGTMDLADHLPKYETKKGVDYSRDSEGNRQIAFVCHSELADPGVWKNEMERRLDARCYREMCLAVASFYYDEAKKTWDCYRNATRVKDKNNIEGKVTLEEQEEILNRIPIEEFLIPMGKKKE